MDDPRYTPDNDPANQQHRPMGKGMLFVAWILVLGMLTLFFGGWEERQYNPNANPVSREQGNVIEVALTRNRFNHYVTKGLINGEPVTFLLDTGATDVVIPAAIAQRLRLQRGRAMSAYTANGVVEVYSTQINSLSIGDITLRNIRASINPAMNNQEILLGMSALKQVEFTQRGNTLTLRYRP